MAEKKRRTFESLSVPGRRLLHKSHDPTGAHREFECWDSDVAKWLDEQFPGTGWSAKWSSLSTSPLVTHGLYFDDDPEWTTFRVAVQRRLAFLGELGVAMQAKMQPAKSQQTTSDTKRVFLVHGHDEAVREKVARYLEKLDLEPIILHEQPSKGRTIIEKFTENADVAYAIVLLTADDIGGPKGTDANNLSPRARQNVLFELGYFMRALGREHVCALHEPGVEILSDYSGVVYITLDPAEAWRFALAKEMKAAGLPVDMNNAI